MLINQLVQSEVRLGIVGGGQLGRMLAQKAVEWNLPCVYMDKQGAKASAGIVCSQSEQGSMTNYEDVLRFGKTVDWLTVESDNVNVQALQELEDLGKNVFPRAKTLEIIQDKGLQRQFCQKQGLAQPQFKVFEDKASLLADEGLQYPAIIKTRKAGYDGKGVFLIENKQQLAELPDVPLLYEQKVNIVRELTVIAVRRASGDVLTYPTIELFMKPSAYLVDYLLCPAQLSESLDRQAQSMAAQLIEGLDACGLLAVELFLDDQGQILINECSPRPHNSGHQTIEASMTSQYENHLRAIFDLPLGSCDSKAPAAMVNLLAEPTAKGPVNYQGLEEVMALPGATVHIYGKPQMSPNRKMGHVTIVNQSYDELLHLVQEVQKKVRIQ